MSGASRGELLCGSGHRQAAQEAGTAQLRVRVPLRAGHPIFPFTPLCSPAYLFADIVPPRSKLGPVNLLRWGLVWILFPLVLVALFWSEGRPTALLGRAGQGRPRSGAELACGSPGTPCLLQFLPRSFQGRVAVLSHGAQG